MKITDEHMFYGAALSQIAKDERFTAVNSVEYQGRRSRSAFHINTDIGIYIKKADHPKSVNEYLFTYTQDNLLELKELHDTGVYPATLF